MHGHIHACLREMVLEKFGEKIWKKIVAGAKCDDERDFMVFHTYDDSKLNKLVEVAAKVLGMDVNAVLETYGDHFYTYVYRKGYDSMVRTLGNNFITFVHNLDNLHSLLSLTYKGMEPPSFRWTIEDDKHYLHVYSIRKGLYPIAIGLLKKCAKEIFDVDAEMRVVEVKTENINRKQFKAYMKAEVTLSGKGHQDTIEKNKAHHEGSLVNLQDDMHALVTMESDLFHRALPYSIIFDKNLIIKGRGLSISILCPEIRQKNACLSEIFLLKSPELDLTYDNIVANKTYPFLLLRESTQTDESDDEPPLYFKGNMVPLDGDGHYVFMGSIFFGTLKELIECKPYYTKMPADELTREILFTNEQRRADVEMSKKLDETTVELRQIAMELEKEKKKTDDLLLEMLPQKVAIQLRNGQTVEAEKFESSTILFSDIVTFTNMASVCEPMQVVDVLNDMFQRFDRLTGIHQVYKVETIGDAYMVVGGVPERTPDHMNRICDMALGMIHESNLVISPATKKPLQIRVGVHTGAVVSGVVGMKMPRYCLFGDSVNTASRMESHGVPGCIHVSDSTQAVLRSSNFIFRSRGIIPVKGKGTMNTYFLVGKDGKILVPLDPEVLKPASSAAEPPPRVETIRRVEPPETSAPQKTPETSAPQKTPNPVIDRKGSNISIKSRSTFCQML